MKVLVLGSGAKDHAIAWWFSKSRLIDGLFVAPSNPGTETLAKNLSEVNPSDKEQVLKACKENDINFVFIGTEAPLFSGVVDYLNKNGIATFGAPGFALKLEGDRHFAREFSSRHNITMPSYHLFHDEESISAFLKRHEGEHFVVKRNSMSPSRVMMDSNDYNTLMNFARQLLPEGDILLEDHLKGLPVTVTVLLDDHQGCLALPLCSEYTKSENEDEGSATGGMGAICPLPLDKDTKKRIFEEIIQPALYGLKVEHLSYKGVLTFSIMLTKFGPVLVDYHVRLNDPATQAMVPIIRNDLVELMLAMQENTLGQVTLQTTTDSAVCVVVASKGYPAEPESGKILSPIPSPFMTNAINGYPNIFFGAVKTNEKGEIETTGGRAVTIVGLGENIINANSSAYKNISTIRFQGSWYREDIGNKFFEN